MDRNIAEQLNKAYEAFRQACMDRDSAVKELKQKVCACVSISLFLWAILIIDLSFAGLASSVIWDEDSYRSLLYVKKAHCHPLRML